MSNPPYRLYIADDIASRHKGLTDEEAHKLFLGKCKDIYMSMLPRRLRRRKDVRPPDQLIEGTIGFIALAELSGRAWLMPDNVLRFVEILKTEGYTICAFREADSQS